LRLLREAASVVETAGKLGSHGIFAFVYCEWKC
jgi:hypothetical protein